MRVSLDETLRLYLKGSAGLDQVREWMTLHQWDLDDPGRVLTDEVDAAPAQLGDGYITESEVRAWLAHAMETHSSTPACP